MSKPEMKYSVFKPEDLRLVGRAPVCTFCGKFKAPLNSADGNEDEPTVYLCCNGCDSKPDSGEVN